MSGLPWIPLSVDFPDSRKAVALGVALQNPLAWAYVVRLWTWCAKNAPDGRVDGPAAVAVVEHAAGWMGANGALVEAASLPHIALLDVTEQGFAVHDWPDHCGAHVEKREKDRQRMRKSRKANRSRTVREPRAHVRGEREREIERETEREDLEARTQAAAVREAGSEARQAIESARGAAPHPLTDEVVRALRARAIEPAYPANGSRGPVEAAIREVGVQAAVERICAAWDTSQPWLTFYLQTITGRAPSPKGKQAAPTNAPAGIGTDWGKPPF